MTYEEMEPQLISLIAKIRNMDASSISSETPVSVVAPKSLLMVAINAQIEGTLGIAIPIREVMNARTIGDVVQLAIDHQ